MPWFKYNGKLTYYDTWLIVNLHDKNELCKYYINLLNMYNRTIKLQLPMHGGHITVIAGKYERITKNFELWRKYEGETINFEYSNEVLHDDNYYWLTVRCKRIEDIRCELGLPPTIKWPWHLTIGNLKFSN